MVNKNISSKQFFFGNRGAALIYSLWALCLLAFFAAVVGSAVHAYLRMGGYFQNSPRARYAAESAIKLAIDFLANDKNGYDALTESWASRALSRDRASRVADIPIGQGAFSFEIVDEARKINLKTAPTETIKRLLEHAGGADAKTAREIATAILDWQDIDDGTREGGAENFYYRTLEDPYDTPNRKLEVLEELLWIKGVTPELFKKVRDFVTLWGDGKININTASREVLLSLGCVPSLADKIIAYRNGRDETPGTEDDRFFVGVGSIPAELSAEGFLGFEDDAVLLQLHSTGVFTVSSGYFSVKAQGTLSGRAERVEAVVDRSGTISSWRE